MTSPTLAARPSESLPTLPSSHNPDLDKWLQMVSDPLFQRALVGLQQSRFQRLFRLMGASSPDGAGAEESYRVAGELRLIELLLNPESPDVMAALGSKFVGPDQAPQEAYVRRTTDPQENSDGW